MSNSSEAVEAQRLGPRGDILLRISAELAGARDACQVG